MMPGQSSRLSRSRRRRLEMIVEAAGDGACILIVLGLPAMSLRHCEGGA